MRCTVALFGLALTGALVTGAAAQAPDNGAFFNEQVRRNQSSGIGSLPSAVPPPTITGPGAFYHDEVRQRQEGRIGRRPVTPRVNPGIDVDRWVVRPSEPTPHVGTSGGLRGTATRRTPRRSD